jgi:hypothetical protein
MVTRSVCLYFFLGRSFGAGLQRTFQSLIADVNLIRANENANTHHSCKKFLDLRLLVVASIIVGFMFAFCYVVEAFFPVSCQNSISKVSLHPYINVGRVVVPTSTSFDTTRTSTTSTRHHDNGKIFVETAAVTATTAI